MDDRTMPPEARGCSEPFVNPDILHLRNLVKDLEEGNVKVSHSILAVELGAILDGLEKRPEGALADGNVAHHVGVIERCLRAIPGGIGGFSRQTAKISLDAAAKLRELLARSPASWAMLVNEPVKELEPDAEGFRQFEASGLVNARIVLYAQDGSSTLLELRNLEKEA